MCDGSSQHLVLTYLGMGHTRMTLDTLAASARGMQSSRVFFNAVGGALVSAPAMWYLPSPALTAGVGSPSESDPINATSRGGPGSQHPVLLVRLPPGSCSVPLHKVKHVPPFYVLYPRDEITLPQRVKFLNTYQVLSLTILPSETLFQVLN